MICLIFLEIVTLKLYPVENINRNVDIYENAQFKKRIKNFPDDKYYYRNSFCYHKTIYILEYDILYNMVDHYYYGNWKV